jgi:hypothetical protein
MFEGTICSVSDVGAAAQQMGGKLELEKCGFFSKCTHGVEKIDVTLSTGGYVEILYCEADWIKVGPVLLVFLIFCWYIWSKMRALDFRRKQEEGGGSSMGHHEKRHRR